MVKLKVFRTHYSRFCTHLTLNQLFTNEFNQPINNMNKLFTLLLITACTNAFSQKLDTLTVEKIMRDPKWIGISPTNVYWGDDSKKVYFDLDPHNGEPGELFSATPTENKPV